TIRLEIKKSYRHPHHTPADIAVLVLVWQAYPRPQPEKSVADPLLSRWSPEAEPGRCSPEVEPPTRRGREVFAEPSYYFCKFLATISAMSRTSMAVSGSSFAVSSVIIRMQNGHPVAPVRAPVCFNSR